MHWEKWDFWEFSDFSQIIVPKDKNSHADFCMSVLSVLSVLKFCMALLAQLALSTLKLTILTILTERFFFPKRLDNLLKNVYTFLKKLTLVLTLLTLILNPLTLKVPKVSIVPVQFFLCSFSLNGIQTSIVLYTTCIIQSVQKVIYSLYIV